MKEFKNYATRKVRVSRVNNSVINPDGTVTETKGNVYEERPMRSVENIITYLNNDPKYADSIKYNLYTDRTEYNGQPIKKATINEIAVDVEKGLGFYSPSKVKCAVHCISADKKKEYHPVIDYLNSLTWDGKSRVETMLIDWFKAEDTPLTRAISKTWMEAAVKRIMEPGCLFEYSLILTGNGCSHIQGTDMHTFFERLSAGFGLATNIDIKEEKKYAPVLNQSWICVMDELRGITQLQQSWIRYIVRQRKDVYRPSYEKYYIENKRHCVFVGTTNNKTFLKYNTFSPDTKYWIVKCDNVDLDRINSEFDDKTVKQLWAEAYYMYKNNSDIHPDVEKVEDMIRNQNENI